MYKLRFDLETLAAAFLATCTIYVMCILKAVY